MAALVAVLFVVSAVLKGREEADEGPPARGLPGVQLRELGERAGLKVGTAVDDGALRREPGYRTVLRREFSSVTPENAMKWSVMEARRGKVDWRGADRVVREAEKAGQGVRGHTLVWFNQVPGWVQGLKGDALRDVMRTRIRDVMERYRGRVRTWDVVNEPFDDDGTRRESLWERELGPGYVEDALRTARRTDAKASLWINEIGADAIGTKSDALFALVKELKAKGVPLDGVGFQAHVNLKGVPATFARNLSRFAALGVDVAVTEADVALQADAGPRQLRAQARVYADVVAACRGVRRCRGVTFWGFTDRYSWISATQPGMGQATLLDDELRAKPAYRAVQRGLR